jgi:hypothetical protein
MGEQANLSGPAAGKVTGRAASLVATIVDASRPAWAQAGGARALALILRRQALAQRDALTQRAAMDYARARAELGSRDGTRDLEFGEVVRAAAQAPVATAAIAAIAVDIAQLAALLASPGAADRRAHAAAAA